MLDKISFPHEVKTFHGVEMVAKVVLSSELIDQS